MKKKQKPWVLNNNALSKKSKTTKVIIALLFVTMFQAYSLNGSQSFAQESKKVTGVVTDVNGDPLPGVNVYQKSDSQSGVITDVTGSYAINISSSDDLLVFSFVGFVDQEINVTGKEVINVSLIEEITDLDEVVVIAYGTRKKSHLTAAVEQISGKALENRPLRSVADGLKGMVAGLNVTAPNGAPEAGLNLNIRGFTGLGISGSPLILVDGVERSINDINPNDVESYTVLKDGAATAIYGSRAPYGIVLITTKSGSKGDNMRVTYSANFRYGTPGKTGTIGRSDDWAKMVNEANRNTPGGGKGGVFSEKVIAQMTAYAEGDYTNEVFDGINPEEIPYGIYAIADNKWSNHYSSFGNFNWIEAATRDVVPSQQHNLSFSGGSDKTSYYLSLGYNENQGIFKGPNFKNRYSTLMKVNSDLKNWLSIGAMANYVNTNEEGPNFRGAGRNYGNMWMQFARVWPVSPMTLPNGTPHHDSILPSMIGDAGSETKDRNNITLTGEMIFKPIRGLQVKTAYTWRQHVSEYQNIELPVYSILPNGTKKLSNRAVKKSLIERSFTKTDYHTVDLTAAYTKTLGENHNFYGLVGFQQEENKYLYLRGSGMNLYSESVPTISTAADEKKTYDRLYSWATRGFFGRLSYNYGEKYFVEFNFRKDATSRFKKDNRWGTFPSISGAWNVAKENFWTNKDLISMFKVRGSWSTSGNANVDANGNNRIDIEEYYLFHPSITAKLSNKRILGGKLGSYVLPPSLVSDQLTWAKPTTIDIGFDAHGLRNRLEVVYDWYQRTIKDNFGPADPLPKVLGTHAPKSNNAVVETRGWEIKIAWRDEAFRLLGKPFNYRVQFNMSDYIGYVVEYKDNGTGQRKDQWTRGEVFGQNYLYTSNGIAQNLDDLYANVAHTSKWIYPGDLMIADTNGDGEINSGTGGTWYSMGDINKSGFNYPRRRYGIGLGGEWNNFNFSMQLDGVGHWEVYSDNMFVMGTRGSKWWAPYFVEHQKLGYWKPDNPDAFYPRTTMNSKNLKPANDQYALDLSHLRIRNISLGYNIPKKIIDKVGLSKVYVYASAENLGYIYNNAFVKFDPDVLGVKGGQGYPLQKYMSFGVNVEF